MKYWLLKSEPSTWSWNDQQKNHTTHWDGVRNYQAQNNMRNMAIGDLAFFYHSVTERCIVGIVKIVKTFYPESTDSRFGMVDVAFYKSLLTPISLEKIKNIPDLQHLALVRQSRLSVMSIDEEAWKKLLNLGGLKESDV